MMNNLFSIFDPTSSLPLPLNWLNLSLVMFLIFPSYWILQSPFYMTFKTITSALILEFSTLLKNNKISVLMFISLFFLILHTNILGLLAYSFTSTSHLAITLSLALPFWLGFILFSITHNTLNFLAHLVPLGTPAPLMPFMVIIEVISNIIRPITLSVRLAANMIAGHLLLTLLSNLLPASSVLIFTLTFSGQILLMVLETAVAIIQAYVFSILTTLYASEA
uniref:ATP synthase subunit a n=1 Tax=Fabaeformiscandona kushiroensis TaxID=1564202 RepID=A0A0S3PNE4_9CRUS|nr:ATPase subunit 6 [Fabaeformiscandona kushiroensis]